VTIDSLLGNNRNTIINVPLNLNSDRIKENVKNFKQKKNTVAKISNINLHIDDHLGTKTKKIVKN